MKIYNSNILNHQQRWWLSLITGIISSLILGLAYAWLSSFLAIELEIVFIGIGWLIGFIIQKVGHGVQSKFAILAAVLALLCFLIGDIVSLFGFSIIMHPTSWFAALKFTVRNLFYLNLSSLLRLLFRLVGVVFAYNTARIV